MRIQELRVGSWVNLKDKGYYNISSGHDLEEISDWLGDTDYCTGILLSGELLHKGCGFEYVFGGFTKPLSNIDPHYRLTFKSRGIKTPCLFVEYDGDNSAPMVHIVFLHQLQDLYLGLTGEELEIKL